MVLALANSCVAKDLVDLLVRPDIGEHGSNHDRDGRVFGEPIKQWLDQDKFQKQGGLRMLSINKIASTEAINASLKGLDSAGWSWIEITWTDTTGIEIAGRLKPGLQRGIDNHTPSR